MYGLLFQDLPHPFLGHLYIFVYLEDFVCAWFAEGVFVNDSGTSLYQMVTRVYPAPGCEHLAIQVCLQVFWVCLPEKQ